MPIAVIHILQGRPDAIKAQMIDAVSRALSETLQAPLPTVRVLVNEVPPAQWGIGGETVQEKRLREADASQQADVER